MPHAEPSTEQLVHRAQAGDELAVSQLLDHHRQRLRRMVSVRMDNRLTARLDPSDVVQETLMEASRKLPDYLVRRPVSFYPWLRRIAWEKLVHLHVRHIDARKRSVNREARVTMILPDESVMHLADRLVAKGASPSAQAENKELRQQVRSALKQLPEKDREVLVLRYLEQSSTSEIAEILNITSGAVKTRHFRAVRRLHALLGEQE